MRGGLFGGAIASIALLAGCQSTVDAASDRPQAIVAATPTDVKAVVIGTYAIMGYSLIRNSDYQIALEQSKERSLVERLYTPRTNSRMTFTFVPSGMGTLVIGDGVLVRYNDAGIERTVPTNGGVERTQFTLNAISAGFAAKRPVDAIVAETAAATKAKFGS